MPQAVTLQDCAKMRGMRDVAVVLLLVLCSASCAVDDVIEPAKVAAADCLAEVCHLLVFGDLRGSDESVVAEVSRIVRDYPRRIVFLTFVESREDLDVLFSPVGVRSYDWAEALPQLEPARKHAAQKRAVLAYLRDGVLEVVRWDPGRSERRVSVRRTGAPAATESGPSGEVFYGSVDRKRGHIRLYLAAASMEGLPGQMEGIRKWLKMTDEMVLHVTFLGQKRVIDDRFPVHNPLFGAWPDSREELRSGTGAWCDSPPARTKLPIRCFAVVGMQGGSGGPG